MKLVWNQNARSVVLDSVFRLADVLSFDDSRDDAAESQRNEKKRQSQLSGRHLDLTQHSGSLIMRHGDLNLTQHESAFQKSFLIRIDYGSISAQHGRSGCEDRY